MKQGDYGAVFALISKLSKDDVIDVQTNRGTFSYRVRERIIIDPNRSQENFAGLKGENLVLVSCWPVGTDWQRIAVRAEQIY